MWWVQQLVLDITRTLAISSGSIFLISFCVQCRHELKQPVAAVHVHILCCGCSVVRRAWQRGACSGDFSNLMKGCLVTSLDSSGVYCCCFSTHLHDAERISVHIFTSSMAVRYPTFVSQSYLQIQWLSCSEITFSKGEALSEEMIIALNHLEKGMWREWKMTKIEAIWKETVFFKGKLRSRLSNNESSSNLR